MRTVNVLVVSKPIPEGTSGDQLTNLVTVKTLPASAVPAGIVTTLAEIKGRVANTELQPGEQLLASRFVDPASLAQAGTVEVPKGLQQVSVLLDSQRVLGGNLNAGDTVGVFLSLEGGGTHLQLHKVLVTRVQGGLTPAPSTDTKDAAATPAPLPQGSVMVTLAVSARDAEKIVFTAENGHIWLSHETKDAAESGTSVVTGKSVFQ
nr:RcpC/CpaB family pilus assembly protein [Microlunatus panaciterrae]